ncbi:hypothetical protein HELRODRAFT_167499 [Helobdella robusta]|uniref:Protein kinase domain-containing protein n=1 Tax=Helobdella robusta TaxID=6412 RepID=T1EZF8_HELRO|nr:hypothetical protein HELRODRAFT_167499 [Helobdella robusta]ESO10982.1 hypothetical protein HELRODRAFT_167499 [Helobdella robusta]
MPPPMVVDQVFNELNLKLSNNPHLDIMNASTTVTSSKSLTRNSSPTVFMTLLSEDEKRTGLDGEPKNSLKASEVNKTKEDNEAEADDEPATLAAHDPTAIRVEDYSFDTFLTGDAAENKKLREEFQLHHYYRGKRLHRIVVKNQKEETTGNQGRFIGVIQVVKGKKVIVDANALYEDLKHALKKKTAIFKKQNPNELEAENFKKNVSDFIEKMADVRPHLYIGPFQLLSELSRDLEYNIILVMTRNENECKEFSMKVFKRLRMNSLMLEKMKILEKVTYTGQSFIVQSECAIYTKAHICLVTEFMDGGDLMYHLKIEKNFSDLRSLFYFLCVLSALEFLHSHSIVHRNIHPSNVFLDKYGYVKLGNFKCARRTTSKLYDSFKSSASVRETEMKLYDYRQSVAMLHLMMSGQLLRTSPAVVMAYDLRLDAKLTIAKIVSWRVRDYKPPADMSNMPFLKLIEYSLVADRKYDPPVYQRFYVSSLHIFEN